MKNKPKINSQKKSGKNYNKHSGNKNFSMTSNSSNFRSQNKLSFKNKERFGNFINTKEFNIKNNNRVDKSREFNKVKNEKSCEDLIWGKHSVYSALVSERPINKIWCTSEIRSSEKFFQILKEVKNHGVLIEEVQWERLSQITFGAVHQGIVLQVAYTKTISLKTLIKQAKTKYTYPTILCLDNITDPHNVGAIIRSAEAFGCTGIVIPQRRSAGITGTVAKVAAGALENISISRVVNLNKSLQELKDEEFSIIGLKENGNINISNFKENVPLVIVIGSENKGLSVLTQKNCDYLVRIPLRGRTSSLNASVAAAISLFHFTKSSYSSQ